MSARRRLGVALLAAAGLWLLAAGGWIHAKAWLAQALLERAWNESLAHGGPEKPWPWADTWPVARMEVPAEGVELIVLAGDSGQALAFGPGHTGGSAMPGQGGTVLISAHRDTQFRFLRRLHIGEAICLQTRAGRFVYRVDGARVVDSRTTRVADDRAGGERLVLVTCYPFNAIVPGGPLRYVVTATRQGRVEL